MPGHVKPGLSHRVPSSEKTDLLCVCVWGGGGGEMEGEKTFEPLNLFISRMTVLGRGLIFQPVLASLYYTQRERERERKRERERERENSLQRMLPLHHTISNDGRVCLVLFVLNVSHFVLNFPIIPRIPCPSYNGVR